MCAGVSVGPTFRESLISFETSAVPLICPRVFSGCERPQMGLRRARSASIKAGPVAHCGDLTSDRIQAGQLKRTFIRLSLTSVHFNEDPAAIRHGAQEANDVAWKGETFPCFHGYPALFNRRFFVDPVCDLHRTIGGLFPGASRGNYQPRAMGATINSERGRGVLRRRACRHERSNLRPIVHRRGRLADNPVWALRLRGIRCFSYLLQKRVHALRPLHGFKLRACLQAINGVACLSTHGLAQAREHGRYECAQTLHCDGPADRVCG